jgi:hypothetical protein
MSKSNHRWRFNVVPGVVPKGPPSEPLGCVKRPFDTEEEAQEFEPAQRPYRCSYCTKWHLTHHRQVRRHVNHDLPARSPRTTATTATRRLSLLRMADARKVTVPWTCDGCEMELFGLQLVDEAGARTWTMLPAGWWYYPVDHGDTDGDGGHMVMLHAFCSETCVRASLERAAKAALEPSLERAAKAAPSPRKNEKGPLRSTLGELLIARRKIVG